MNENIVEQAALAWFEAVGFDTRKGADVSPGSETPLRDDYERVVLEPRLRAALRKINGHLPEDAIEQAVRVVSRPPEPTLEQNNRWFHRLLTDGVDVEYRTKDGETRGDKAWLVDFANPAANDLAVVNQFTVKCGNHTRRADLIVFLNGLPIADIELKDPTDERADIWKAYRQIQGYKRDVPPLYWYNELLAISDGDSTRVGSLTAGTDRFSPWRSIEDCREPGTPHLETLIKGLFEPARLLDYLRHCVTFEQDERTGDIIKKIAGYHQFRAVREARAAVKAALKPTAGKGDGRGGVIWHTQGSGKSLTMLMLSGALIADEQLGNPTIVVVTDRNDLDGQLFGTFAGGVRRIRRHLRHPPGHPGQRHRPNLLRDALGETAAG